MGPTSHVSGGGIVPGAPKFFFVASCLICTKQEKQPSPSSLCICQLSYTCQVSLHFIFFFVFGYLHGVICMEFIMGAYYALGELVSSLICNG